jgi:GDP-4-dehydro-6-deoxy-D-mannose reductase
MSENRRLLLVGANGFVGSHLASAADADGLRVITAGRGPEDLACDLLDAAGVEACVEAAQPDLVVNAAGAASVGRSWEQPSETFAVNASGVLNLLEAVARRAPAAHVTCLSSADVYGVREQRELPLGEALKPLPVTPYGGSKAAMEAICGQYARGRGLRIAVSRTFNLVGPGQSPRFAVSSFARRVAEAEREGDPAVEVALGNPDAARDFTDVRDGARALLELSRQELDGTYNLCSGRSATIAEVVALLAGLARVPVTARRDPDLERPADPPALVGDPSRLREATGFAAVIPLARTVSDLLEHWRARLASA